MFAASSEADPLRQPFQRFLGDENLLEGEQLIGVYGVHLAQLLRDSW